MTCTFFGHSNCPDSIKADIYDSIIYLIENKNVTTFLVGNQGNFDRLVLLTLQVIQSEYRHIRYSVVLAYMPKSASNNLAHSIFPEGLENIPPAYAISHRNKWMITQSDYVITYVRHKTGGASKFKDYATKKNKIIIEL